MGTNRIFTLALYGILAFLVTAAAWKACEMKKQQLADSKKQTDLNQQMRDLGYVENDSTEVGSAYSGNTTAQTPAGTYKDGTMETSTITATGGEKTTATGIEEETIVADKPVTSSTKTGKTTKGQTDDVLDLDTDDNDNRDFLVVTGTFTVMDNARSAMETLIKQGYQDAEVGKFNRGKYACAVADRFKTRSSAEALAAKLKKKGYKDAFVKRKK